MKRELKSQLLYGMVVLFLGITLGACSDHDEDDGPALGPNGQRLIRRIVSSYYSDNEKEGTNDYSFSYDGEGRLKAVNGKSIYISEDDGKEYTDNASMTISIDGKTLKVVNKYYGDELKETMTEVGTYTLNDDFYIVSGKLVEEDYDKEGTEYTFTYDADGYLINNTRNNNRYTYTWDNGNMTVGAYSSRPVYAKEENKSAFDFLYFCDVDLIEFEDQFLGAAGYLGKKNKNLVSETLYARYEYTFDSDGLVKTIKEIEKHGSGYTIYEISYK